MKAVMLANIVVMSIFSVCVTCAAIRFDDPGILWWYLLLTVIGFTYKSGGGADNA